MVRVAEHYTSRSETVGGIGGNDGDAELVFHVLECGSSLVARNAVFLFSPNTYHGLVRGPMKITPLGGGLWNVCVRYAKLQNKIAVTIDTMCEKIKRMKSRETIANVKVRYTGAALAAAPDHKRLIGVSKDKVDGVEVYDPGTFKLTMAWSSKFLTIRPDYIASVIAMGATCNETAVILNWRGQTFEFARGDLLFIGGTFHETSDDGCDISLKFEGRITDAEIAVGDLDGAAIATLACETEGGSVLVTVTGGGTTGDLDAGMAVVGPRIPAGTVIFSVNSIDTFSLSIAATGAGTQIDDLAVSNPFLPSKEGHWYVWLKTAKERNPVTLKEVDVPDSAHIERVYEYSDFAILEVFDIVTTQATDDEDFPPEDWPDDGDEVGGGGDWGNPFGGENLQPEDFQFGMGGPI